MNERMRLASDGIRASADRLNRLLAAVEAYLQRLGMGVEAWVELTGRGQFGYARLPGGKWGLAVQVPSGTTPFPLSKAKLEIRAAAVPLIPSLLDALAVAADKLHADLNAACNIAEQMADAMIRTMREVEA